MLPPVSARGAAGAGVGGEDVVDGADDLVHALDVSLAGVELGVEEEDPLDDLPVRLLPRLHDGRVVLRRLLPAVGQCARTHSFPAHILPTEHHIDDPKHYHHYHGYLGLELGLGDPGVQLLPRPGAGVRRGLLEEGEVRAQPPHVLVDLEQHLHQSQLGTPRSRDTQGPMRGRTSLSRK